MFALTMPRLTLARSICLEFFFSPCLMNVKCVPRYSAAYLMLCLAPGL